MRCLLTAFEPFDGTPWNASLEGCRAFLAARAQGAGPADLDLQFEVLPVEYGADTAAVERALTHFVQEGGPPDVVLHTGQAAGTREVRVERLAVNVRYAEDGPNRALFPHSRAEEAGPAALFATLPVEETTAAILAAGVPAVVSNHAGIYLCNHVLYHSLRRAERDGMAAGRWIGFLHVPALPQQAAPGEPFLSAEEIGRAIAATLEYLAAAKAAISISSGDRTYNSIRYYPASDLDLPVLAELNQQLIRDEGHRNRMSLAELEERMQGWLRGEYAAVLFRNESEPIGYALYRREAEHIYLRQFFVRPEYRRQGVGRAALEWLRANAWPGTARIRLDVLVGNERGIAFWRSVGFRDYCLTMELDSRL